MEQQLLIPDAVYTRPAPSLEYFPSTRKNFQILSEKPQFRLINWKKTTNFYLPMPYVHYYFEYFPPANKWYLHGMTMSSCSLMEGRETSFPCLPNFYEMRPCMVGPDDQADKQPEEVINRLWQGQFNGDGSLAWHPIWRTLAHRAGAKRGDRPAVLEYWETLDIDTMLHAMPWQTNIVLE